MICDVTPDIESVWDCTPGRKIIEEKSKPSKVFFQGVFLRKPFQKTKMKYDIIFWCLKDMSFVRNEDYVAYGILLLPITINRGLSIGDPNNVLSLKLRKATV